MNANGYGGANITNRGAFYFKSGGLGGSKNGIDIFDDDKNYTIGFDSSRANSSVDIEGNNVYVENGEVRVSNYTARYWKRIS